MPWLAAACLTFTLALLFAASCASGPSKEYSHAGDLVTEWPVGAELTLRDHLGSGVAVVDDKGADRFQRSYHPYGSTRSELVADLGAATGQADHYVGNERDVGADLGHFHARPYDYQVGRFLGPDPLRLFPNWKDDASTAQLAAYSYTAGNPIGLLDPSGLSPNDGTVNGPSFGSRTQGAYPGFNFSNSSGPTLMETWHAIPTVDKVAVGAGAVPYVGDYVSAGVSLYAFADDPSVATGVDLGLDGLGAALPFVPALGTARRVKRGLGAAEDVAEAASDIRAAIHVTPHGVALPKGGKYDIPSNYVENPYQQGRSYGEVLDGKFQERLRIDAATPKGKKGPNNSHYHKDGKSRHFSPAPGDPDPGFAP